METIKSDNSKINAELLAQNERYRDALEKIDSQALCVAITPVSEHTEMLQRIVEIAQQALTGE